MMMEIIIKNDINSNNDSVNYKSNIKVTFEK